MTITDHLLQFIVAVPLYIVIYNYKIKRSVLDAICDGQINQLAHGGWLPEHGLGCLFTL
jgi:hypothetical protein